MDENEILEFELDGQSFGISIGVIEEISDAQKTTEIPNSHPSVEGIYARRGGTTTVLSLRNCLGKNQEGPSSGDFIVVRVSAAEVALHVDSVVGIHKLSKSDVIEPSKMNDTAAVRAVAKVQDKLVTILDLENIVSEITEMQEVL